jgi:hypothetical protein
MEPSALYSSPIKEPATWQLTTDHDEKSKILDPWQITLDSNNT